MVYYKPIYITHRIHGAAIYGNIYHQYTPNVSIYTLHGSYGLLTKLKHGGCKPPYTPSPRFLRREILAVVRILRLRPCSTRIPGSKSREKPWDVCENQKATQLWSFMSYNCL